MREITRRQALLGALAGGSSLALQGCAGLDSARPPQSGRRPNLLLVFPDQMRGSALGFLGREPVLTPNLDRFGAQSLVLTDAVSNYPICSPFRASLLSGRYPVAHGVVNNCNSRSAPHGSELRTEERCWSDVLAAAGYDLGYIGKWHLDSPRKPYVDTYNNRGKVAWNEWTPPHRRHGFAYWHAYGTYDRHNRPQYWSTDAPRSRRTVGDKWGPEYEADRAIRWLETKAGGDKPFALVVSMNPPHTPYDQVPGRYLERYAGRTPEELVTHRSLDHKARDRFTRLARRHTKNYFAQITGVDDQFGRILAALDRLDLAEETIVLFCSDHGNCLGAHREVTKNNPYEESLIIPFMIRWPGRIAARRDPLLLSVPDIHPTLLGLMGLADRIPSTVQGTNHAGLFRTGRGPRPTSALYMKMPVGDPAGGRRGVRTGRHTLVLDAPGRGESRIMLFDNREDPHQLNDLGATRPDLVARLYREELVPWLERTGDGWRRPPLPA